MVGAELSGSTVFHCYDANGNVADVVDTAGGSAAHYEYDPFGAVVSQVGLQSTNNPFRFSTKYHDDETRLVYYGYRFYYPDSGRWLNRDPLGEFGGKSMYAFVVNSPVIYVDFVGLKGLRLRKEDANPKMCKRIAALMDKWAMGQNQDLWDHWKSGSGSSMDIPFWWFDPANVQRSKHLHRSQKRGLAKARALECTGSGTTKYFGYSNPLNMITHMIWYWQLHVECDIEYSAKWDDECCDCKGVSSTSKCKFTASDKIDFWDNPSKKFLLPPYLVDDQFILALIQA